MNRFTITPEFLEASASDNSYDYFANVLMVFAQDNKYKLCMDSTGLAGLSYEEIIRKYECLQVWLKVLNGKSHNIEKVSVASKNYQDNRDLFMSIANATPPYKRLVTHAKSYYNEKLDQIMHNNICLLDGNEVKEILHYTPPTIVLQYSTGDNSPNINGNNNII